MKFFERDTCVKQVDEMIGISDDMEDTMVRIYKAGIAFGETPTESKRATGQYRIDANWTEKKKPYFNIWPKIQEAFTKTSLDIPGTVIRLPLEPILIRFSEQDPIPVNDKIEIRSILVSTVDVNVDKGSYESKGLSMWIDVGELMVIKDISIPVYTYAIFPLLQESVEETLRKLALNAIELHTFIKDDPEGETLTIEKAAKVVMSLCLLGTDSDLVTPDVLNKDLLKYKRTLDPTYIHHISPTHMEISIGTIQTNKLYITFESACELSDMFLTMSKQLEEE